MKGQPCCSFTLLDGICLHSRFIGVARKGWVWQRDRVKKKIIRYPPQEGNAAASHKSQRHISVWGWGSVFHLLVHCISPAYGLFTQVFHGDAGFDSKRMNLSQREDPWKRNIKHKTWRFSFPWCIDAKLINTNDSLGTNEPCCTAATLSHRQSRNVAPLTQQVT